MHSQHTAGRLQPARTPGANTADHVDAFARVPGSRIKTRGIGRPPGHPRQHLKLPPLARLHPGVAVNAKQRAPRAGTSKEGILLAISDPIEETFPWRGRVRFSRPGGSLFRIFGRAETIREEYVQRYTAHFEALENMAAGMGWQLVRHSTGSPLQRCASDLKQALELFGARL